MSLELKLVVVACDEIHAERLLGYVANLMDALEVGQSFVVVYLYGEEQLLVLTAVEGCRGEVHVEFLTC